MEAKLSAHDPRWMAFGLAMPASRVTPAKPTGLVVSLNGTDGLLATCIAPSQATRFRWRLRQVGPGYLFRLAASTVEALAMINPVPPGATVEIIVQAVHDNLQSIPSDPVGITIPPAIAAAAAPSEAEVRAAAEIPAVVPPNGNGSGNGGTSNGRRSVTRTS